MPAPIPSPLILIDTREQLPFAFPCATRRQKLDAGDYSLDGLTDVIAIERKSLQDYVQTITWGKARFEREMHRWAHLRWRYIVVEGSLHDLLAGHVRTAAHPNALLGLTGRLTLSYAPVLFAGSRHAAERLTYCLLQLAWKDLVAAEEVPHAR